MRVKFKKMAAKGLTLMLTVFMLMSGISSVSPAVAKTAKTEGNSVVFSGTPADGVTDKNLASMEKNTPTFAGGGKDLTECVVFHTKVFIDGKQFTNGSNIQATVGAPYSYELNWEYTGDIKPAEGDYFSIQIFKIPGLNISSCKDQSAMINVNNRNIRIGTWDLQYDANGTLTFSMRFSKYASAFKDLKGFKEGNGKLSANSNSDDIFVKDSSGDSSGSIEIVQDEDKPDQPGSIPAPPNGKGWTIPAPPNFNSNDYDFGKGIKWDNSASNKPIGQIEWRAVYVEYMQDLQNKFLKDNIHLLGTDGKGSITDENLKNIDKSRLIATNENYIIEDILDPNQKFAVPKGDPKYKKAPFFLELPIMYPGTGNLLPIYDFGCSFGNGNYDGAGFAGVDIGADIFTHIDENYPQLKGKSPEAYVNAVPMTWTIVNVEGADGLKREKLVINLGKLGAKNESKDFPFKDGVEFTDPLLTKAKTVLNKLTTSANDNITALENGSNSPAAELNAQTAALKNYLDSSNLSNNASDTAFKNFDKWYTANFTGSNKENLLSPLSSAALSELTSVGIDSALEKIAADNSQFGTAKTYLDWKKHYENISTNQAFYAEKRAGYIKKWEYALGRYQLTEAFYANGQVYGFCLKYNTEVVNTSVNKFSNNISIKTKDTILKSEDNATINFKHGVSGTFSLGSAVFKKADAAYGNLASADRNGLAGAEFEVYCAAEVNKFRLFRNADEENWTFEKNDEHLGCFADPSASASGKAYIWSHNKKDSQDDITGIVSGDDALTTLVTDENGTLAIEGLKSSEPHYLVETKAPDGYYLDTTPRQFRTNEENILYDFVPNISRAVKLTKESSYTNAPIEGAEFELYKAEKDNPDKYRLVTGFTDETFTGSDGTKTRYYKYNYNTDSVVSSAPLKTFSNGELNIHGLPEGEYYLKEIKPADGYVISESQKNTKYHFSLKNEINDELKNRLYKENGFSYVLANPDENGNNPKPVYNDEKTKSFTFTKVGKNNETLRDAAFTLLKWTGTEEEYKTSAGDHKFWQPVDMNVASSPYFKTNNKGYSKIEKAGFDGYLTDSKGKITFTDLPNGHFAIMEVKAPNGHELMSHMLYFDVNTTDNTNPQLYWNTGSKNPIAGNNVPNELLPGSLKIHKLVVGNNADLKEKFDFTITLEDENEEPLSGKYNYTLTRQNSKTDGKADENGKITQETGTLTLDSKGQYSFKLAHEDALTVTGLPAGAHYAVKEEPNSSYQLELTNGSGHIASREVVTATAQNRYRTGLLRLTKNTTGPNAEKDRAFEFTLALKDSANKPLSGNFAYKGSAAVGIEAPADGTMTFDKKGIAKTSLKSGQNITIYGLPAGTEYTISEAEIDDYTIKITTDVRVMDEKSGNIDAQNETSTIDDNSVSGKIQDNKRNDVDFNNISTPDPGELMISKTIECLSIDENQEFTFDITLKDTNGATITNFYPTETNRRDIVDYSDAETPPNTDRPVIKDEIYFDSEGQASVVLKHDEYLLIKGLPSGISYTVTERDAPGYISSLKDPATGKITEDKAAIVAVTNYHREGNLVVSKQVEGRGGDFEKEFTFDIELKNADGKAINGKYNYAGSSIDPEKIEAPENGQLIIKDGKGSFKLKHGQRIVISGLPEGTKYNVSETEGSSGDKYEVECIDSNGKIENKVESNVRFINRYKTGQLMVVKTVVSGDNEKPFNFTVKLDDENINGIYNQMEFKDGVAEFTLRHGDSKIATGLPAGINYIVTEESYDDYNVSSINAEGAIKDEVICRAEFTNTQKELPPDPDNPGGGTEDPDNPGTDIEDSDNQNNGNNQGASNNGSENNASLDKAQQHTKTGDTFMPWVFGALMAASAIGIIVVMLRRKKH